MRPRRAVRAKYDPYECGIEPVRLPATENYPVKFYVVAMLFIIFDIETIFLFPWAVAFRRLGLFGLVEMVVFIGMVFVAYLYVWQKGGLDWEGPRRLGELERARTGGHRRSAGSGEARRRAREDAGRARGGRGEAAEPRPPQRSREDRGRCP